MPHGHHFRFSDATFVVVFVVIATAVGAAGVEGVLADGRGPSPQQQVVVSVCDLRSEPVAAQVSYAYDSLQLTQLVYNEIVEVYERDIVGEDGSLWNYVGALEQLTLVNGSFVPYAGYVAANQLIDFVQHAPTGPLYLVIANYVPLYGRDCHMMGCLPEDMVALAPMGSGLDGVIGDDGWLQTTQPGGTTPAWALASAMGSVVETWLQTEEEARSGIVNIAKNLLGVYYFWGGRSPFNGQLYSQGTQLTGMDCSGFVSLAYRTQGILLPRNANDIFQWSKNVTSGPEDLEVADFLFNADRSNPTHATHIMMVYQRAKHAHDNDLIMESSTNSTRIITAEEKFGMSLDELTWGGMDAAGNLVYWGTAFPLRVEFRLPQFY